MFRTTLRILGLPLLGGCAVALALAAGGGAANGDALILGQANSATAQTSLTGTVNGNPLLRVENGTTAAGSSALLGRMSASPPATDAAGVKGVISSSGASGFGVFGLHQGSGSGVFGQSTNGTGVLGTHTATSGTLPGVEGNTSSTAASAVGVLGKTATAGAGKASSAGVEGVNDGHGFGLLGIAGPQDDSIAIFGQGTTAPAIKGVTGTAGDTVQNSDAAIVGIQQSTFGSGVLGESLDAGFGVFGINRSTFAGRGVEGVSTNGIGVFGSGGEGGGYFSSSDADALEGETFSAGSAGVVGTYSGGGTFGALGVLGTVLVTNGLVPPQGLNTMGVKGVVTIANSVGTAGFANNGTGAIGVRGVSNEGTGVQGESTSGLAGKFVGGVRVSGSITKDYTSGTTNQAIPLAYGVINSSGTKAAGTPNVSSTFDSASNRYVITIAGDTYVATNHITTVTPLLGSGPVIARTTSSSGKLVVVLTGGGGSTPVQQSFSFITYKP